MRGTVTWIRPSVFSNLKTGQGLDAIVGCIEKQGLMK